MKPWTLLVTTRSFGREVPEPMERLKQAGIRIVEWREGSGLAESDLLDKLAEADAWAVSFHPIGPKQLDAAPRLKLIAKHGVGVDNIDIAEATKRGVIITTAPSANDQAVADLTMALLLSMLRRIPEASASVKAGRWDRFLGFGMNGKIMGILGLGRIGQNVARRAKGFGVELIGADPVWPDAAARDIGIRQVTMPELFATADIISLHAPLTRETEGLIGGHEIAQMKPGVWIVNTSRGKVVNEKALYDALVSRKVAGYASDVFEKEPPGFNPLFLLPNVIGTPHMGTHTRESIQQMGDRVADAVLSVFRGERPENVVNPEVFARR